VNITPCDRLQNARPEAPGATSWPAPPAPRDDLVTIFLKRIPGLNQPPGVTPSEMLRLNVAIAPSPSPNRFGVIGGDARR